MTWVLGKLQALSFPDHKARLQSQPQPADSMDATSGRQQEGGLNFLISAEKSPVMSCLPWLHQLWAPPAWPDLRPTAWQLRLSWKTATVTPLGEETNQLKERDLKRNRVGMKGKPASPLLSSHVLVQADTGAVI